MNFIVNFEVKDDKERQACLRFTRIEVLYPGMKVIVKVKWVTTLLFAIY